MTSFSGENSVFSRRESEVRSYCRNFDAVFNTAHGSLITDTAGREYIDFLAGCGALNYGHNDCDMARALIEHIESGGIAQGLDLFTVSKQRFLESFERVILVPRKMNYRLQFTGPTGANGVEAAFKLARKVTGRQNIVAFTNGFHGVTMGALAATGNKHHRMGLSLPGVSRFPFDGYFGPEINTAAMLDQMLADPSSGVEAPAAIVLETVQGEGGLNAASPKWLERVAAIASKYGALLIVDDVQAGCGRTGTFFSFERVGIEPDIIVLSKSISGFGLPMALVLVKPDTDQWKPAEHNGTFRGNTHAFVTARVALEKFWADSSFARAIADKSQLVTERLTEIAGRLPNSRLKGRGMLQGIDVGSGDLAGKICRRCFESGLIIETSGPHDEVIKILAPLTTPDALLLQGLEILRKAVHDTLLKEPIAA
jgi:diaminobutyrate-2-oxoglutarate transaminase